jgi:hypothetical protein
MENKNNENVLEKLEVGQTSKVPLFYLMASIVDFVIIENVDVPEEYYKQLHLKRDIELDFLWDVPGKTRNIFRKHVVIKRITPEDYPEYYV